MENIMSQITLLRHTKVKIDTPSIYSSQMKDFIEAYNQAPIEFDDVSDELKSIIDSVDIVLSSELSRTKETLKYLRKEAQHSDTIFNEAELPYANGKIVKLPATTWAVLFRIMWIFGYSKQSESYKEAKVRAKLSADKLIAYAKANKSVLLVGHGVMNKLISKELMASGVTLVKKTGNGNLGYTVFQVDENIEC
jgi:broad specificity phosphatase PhoE